jgi:alpha-beta hydrolase superfamily lysophospholipase
MGFSQPLSLASPTGATLTLRHQPAAKDAIGVVQVNHGLAEHSARYERFAKALSARGMHVYAHDHRGHGTTTAPDAPLGRFGGGRQAAELVLRDVEAVHYHIATTHPGLPVILFGHSMGGLIGLNATMRLSHRIAGAAIWNANFTAGLAGRAARLVLAWERLRLGSDVPSRALPALTFRAWAKTVKDRRTEFDWLSRDEAEVAKYVADPLCGFDASVEMWSGVFDFVFGGADDAKLATIRKDLPINLVGGRHDPATDMGKAVRTLEKRLRATGISNLETTIYADNRHESLNELNRDEVTAAFADWAVRAIGARA